MYRRRGRAQRVTPSVLVANRHLPGGPVAPPTRLAVLVGGAGRRDSIVLAGSADALGMVSPQHDSKQQNPDEKPQIPEVGVPGQRPLVAAVAGLP